MTKKALSPNAAALLKDVLARHAGLKTTSYVRVSEKHYAAVRSLTAAQLITWVHAPPRASQSWSSPRDFLVRPRRGAQEYLEANADKFAEAERAAVIVKTKRRRIKACKRQWDITRERRHVSRAAEAKAQYVAAALF